MADRDEVREVVTSVAGLDVRHLEKGTGPAMVVLHHSFGSAGWTSLHEELSRHARVLVPDLPGFGASERPDWARHPRDLALLVRVWSDRLGIEDTVLIGAGFGGWVAAELATMLGGRLGGLVLVGAAGLLPAGGRIYDQMLVPHREYVERCFEDHEHYVEAFGVEPSDELLVTWDLNREMVARVAWKPYMYNRRLAPLLTTLDVPALVVWGDHDEIVPVECGEAFAALLPDGRLELVASCGHAVDLERPDRLAELVLTTYASTGSVTACS